MKDRSVTSVSIARTLNFFFKLVNELTLNEKVLASFFDCLVKTPSTAVQCMITC
jgi:hypothetical protein